MLLSWADSRLPQRRAAFQALRKGALLFYYMVPDRYGGRNPVWDAIGYDGRPPRRRADESALADPGAAGDTSLQCDVVIVGSGARGGAAAGVLAGAGLDVIVIESGDYYDDQDFDGSELGAITRYYMGAPTATHDGAGPDRGRGRSGGGRPVCGGSSRERQVPRGDRGVRGDPHPRVAQALRTAQREHRQAPEAPPGRSGCCCATETEERFASVVTASRSCATSYPRSMPATCARGSMAPHRSLKPPALGGSSRRTPSGSPTNRDVRAPERSSWPPPMRRATEPGSASGREPADLDSGDRAHVRAGARGPAHVIGPEGAHPDRRPTACPSHGAVGYSGESYPHHPPEVIHVRAGPCPRCRTPDGCD